MRHWISPEGEIDLAALPLDSVFRQALAGGEGARAAISFLGVIHRHGRPEAGVFLLGLLASAGEDWHLREELVRALDGFHTPGCVQFLCEELRHRKANNANRRYLNAILKVLEGMPAELVEERLTALVEDPALSRRMRQKVDQVLWRVLLRKNH